MQSSEMLHLAILVRTDVSEELSASIIRVSRVGELGRTLTLTSNRSTLQRNTVLTIITLCHIPKDGIFHITQPSSDVYSPELHPERCK
jgi:hypothetical protein